MVIVFVTRHKVAISDTEARMVFLGGYPAEYRPSNSVCAVWVCASVLCLSRSVLIGEALCIERPRLNTWTAAGTVLFREYGSSWLADRYTCDARTYLSKVQCMDVRPRLRVVEITAIMQPITSCAYSYAWLVLDSSFSVCYWYSNATTELPPRRSQQSTIRSAMKYTEVFVSDLFKLINWYCIWYSDPESDFRDSRWRPMLA